MDYGSRQRESRRAGQHQEKKTEKIQLKHTQEVKGERERELGKAMNPQSLPLITYFQSLYFSKVA